MNWLEIANVVANSSSYRDTSASPATSYRYQVGAYSPSFESLSVESNVGHDTGWSLARNSLRRQAKGSDLR